MNEFVYPEIKSGLYLVSLPVGCLSDISFRALHMLSNSDYVAGEDTRSVRSLFKLLKISKSIKSIISYHDHSSAHTRGKIIELIKQGKSVALVSDAGTPLISDPGYKLVKTAIEEGLEVFSVPGPSSLIVALTVSGLPTDTFSFLDQDADSMTAKGDGGLRQMHQYASLNFEDKINTPPDNYEPNTIGNDGMSIEQIQAQRNKDVPKNLAPI